jgi:hypothetical protein
MIKNEGTLITQSILISDLKQMDKSDDSFYPELYCGQYPVHRRVTITGYTHTNKEFNIAYIIAYFYIKNNIEYKLDDVYGYSPVNGIYFCSHDIGQKFEFDGQKPKLKSYFVGDVGYDDPELMSEYSMWSDLLITRQIKFKVGEDLMTIPVSFEELITEAVKSLDSKYKLFDTF